MRGIFFLLLFIVTGSLCAQTDSSMILRVHFLYGSKPKWKYRQLEKKEFGGLHGGHVTLQVNGLDYGFERSGGFHVFSHAKKYKAKFTSVAIDTVNARHRNKKTVTFYIPLSPTQQQVLDSIHHSYCEKVPYDYAFFGMRCAASVREILSQLGIMKQRSRFFNITRAFYPKRLRKKLFRLARENNYGIMCTEGNPQRRWENW